MLSTDGHDALEGPPRPMTPIRSPSRKHRQGHAPRPASPGTASVAVVPAGLRERRRPSLAGTEILPGLKFNDDGAPDSARHVRGVAKHSRAVGRHLTDDFVRLGFTACRGRALALDPLLGNVERIEVIKGPQGTRAAQPDWRPLRTSTKDRR